MADHTMALRGARDRRSVDAVEVEEDGRPTSFDGNHTNRIVSWLIPVPGQKFEGLDEEQILQLMRWTVAGHLAWVVFPIDNV